MTPMAAILKELVAAGLQGESLVAAFERIEAAALKPTDEAAERRRAWDRQRKAAAKQANSTGIPPDSTGSQIPPDSTGIPPENDPRACARGEVLPLLTKGSKEERKIDAQREQARLIGIEFEDQFWPAYPRRVGKPEARKAFTAARIGKGIELATILAGLERYKHDKPDYADWKHPGPWLRGERWSDEHGPGHANGRANGATPSAIKIPDFCFVQPGHNDDADDDAYYARENMQKGEFR